MFLWLDDERTPPEGWEWVKTPRACIAFLARHRDDVEVLSLDHDLGGDSTGREVVHWMIMRDTWPTRGCIVHSANPVGAKRMADDIDRYGPYHRKTLRVDYYEQAAFFADLAASL